MGCCACLQSAMRIPHHIALLLRQSLISSADACMDMLSCTKSMMQMSWALQLLCWRWPLHPPRCAMCNPIEVYVSHVLVALLFQSPFKHHRQFQLTFWNWLCRLHFNAAMLEMHSRLHLLDMHRGDQHSNKPLHSEVSSVGMSPTFSSQDTSHHEEADDINQPNYSSTAESSSSDTSSDAQQVSLLGSNTPEQTDDEVQRQKQAKLAVLAIRRHLRWGG